MSKDRIDTDALQKEVNILDVVGKSLSLTKHGAEFYGVCPFHDDTTASLQVNERKQIYKCFACGAGGDALDFLMRSGATFHEAVDILKGGDLKISGEAQKRIAKLKEVTWKQIMPPSPPFTIDHYKHGKPAKAWAYRDENGKLIGYVCRFNFPDGSKDVIPFTFADDGKGRKEWRWLGFGSPRPLYNLNKLKARPDALVLIVEGEKTADAAELLYPELVVTCWIGGSKAIKEADWSPLHGRKIILWPDNDKEQKYGDKHEKAGQLKPWEEQPGNEAMLEIEAILKDKCPSISWVKNIDELPNKWDVADATKWTPAEAKEYLKKNIYRRGSTPETKAPTESPKVEAPKKIEPPTASEPKKPERPGIPDAIEDQPFRFLGFDKTESGGLRFHFYVKPTQTVVSLPHSGLSKTGLMTLADLNWWESHFPAKNGVNLDAAQQFLIRYSSRRPYSEKNIRGRGAWTEGKNIVLHAGGNLVVNGRPIHIFAHESKYIYEIGDDLAFSTLNPLSNTDASKLMEVLKLMSWERPINPYLFAGWCIIAPICGALKWRSHIWVTGAAGTGKSWVFKEIVRPLLGECALSVQAETTEAGIRQILGHDALPVVFDEAEGGERKDSDRIQTVLNLMRAASADDGGVMAKGSAGGTAKTYRVRSCFAFASISVGVYHASDRSRVSVLGLVQEPDKIVKDTKWIKLQETHYNIVTEDYCERLRARTIKLLPVIIENARTFSKAVAAELGEQRAGDQLGTLLAGAYTLVSDNVISYADACAWVASKDWSEEKANESYKDEIRLLNHLMETMVVVESNGVKWDRTIGELVLVVQENKPDAPVLPDKAQDRLKRFGMKVEGEFLYVSNGADQIRTRLRETAWSKNHNKILQRIKGADHTEPTRFAPGILTRAVKIPLAEVMGNTVPAHAPVPGGGSHDSDETPF
jgi:putative DNA primase/helicase